MQGRGRIGRPTAETGGDRNALLEPQPKALPEAQGVDRRPRRAQRQILVTGRQPGIVALERQSRLRPGLEGQPVEEAQGQEDGLDLVVAVAAPRADLEAQVQLGGRPQDDGGPAQASLFST